MHENVLSLFREHEKRKNREFFFEMVQHASPSLKTGESLLVQIGGLRTSLTLSSGKEENCSVISPRAIIVYFLLSLSAPFVQYFPRHTKAKTTTIVFILK